MNETPLKEYYEGLRSKGVAHHNAKMSLARKIAAICLAVLKSKKSYNEEIVLSQIRYSSVQSKAV